MIGKKNKYDFFVILQTKKYVFYQNHQPFLESIESPSCIDCVFAIEQMESLIPKNYYGFCETDLSVEWHVEQIGYYHKCQNRLKQMIEKASKVRSVCCGYKNLKIPV